MRGNGFKDLIVWQKSMDLVIAVYDLIRSFPESEIYGLTSQIKRSAVSIPSNIAEGSKRKTEKEFSHFLSIALGSGSELETQVEIAKRLGFGHGPKIERVELLLQEVMKMLYKLNEVKRS